jgi:hypothetical protein
MYFYLMSIMGLQHRAVAVQSGVLTILGNDPIATGLLQAAAQHSFLAIGRTGRGVLVALVWCCTG